MPPPPVTSLRRSTSATSAQPSPDLEYQGSSASVTGVPTRRRTGSVSANDNAHAAHHRETELEEKVDYLLATMERIQRHLITAENRLIAHASTAEAQQATLNQHSTEFQELGAHIGDLHSQVQGMSGAMTDLSGDVATTSAELWDVVRHLTADQESILRAPATPMAGRQGSGPGNVPAQPGHVPVPGTVPFMPQLPSRVAAPVAVPVVRPPVSSQKAKPTLPKPFDGNPAKFFNFLAHCQHVFFLHPSTYPLEVDQVGMIMTLLEGPAMTWGTKHMVDRHPMLFSLDLFIEHFSLAFAEKGRVERSGNELKNLRMGATLQDYVIRFRELQSTADCNDAMLQICFRDGLSKELRRLMVSVQQHATVESLISHAFAFDVALEAERLSDRRAQYVPGAYRPFRYDNRPGPGVNPGDNRQQHGGPQPRPGPRGPLTDEEKNRRRQANLCLFCAGAGHVVQNCPVARHGPGYPPGPGGPVRRGRVAAVVGPEEEVQENGPARGL